MIVNHQRPVNLKLTSLTFPAMAIASILHRISGLVLFLLLPILMYFLNQSLDSQNSFDLLYTACETMTCKLLLWSFVTALIYHLLAGIRHIIMDIGFGEHLSSARQTAVFVIAATCVLSVLFGVWIW